MLARKQEISLQLNQLTDAILIGIAFWASHFLRERHLVVLDRLPDIPPFEAFYWILAVVMPFGPLLLELQGYYTYPVYPEGQPQPRPTGARLQPVGWRVGQYLDVTTTNLAALPATVAASQKALALNGLRFGLSAATAKKLDQERIAATYLNLNERVAAIAKAMGRSPADAVLDTLDFEASGNYLQQDAAPKAMRAAAVQEMQAVEEPSFEPGETTLQMRAVGKVRFR